MAWFGHPPKVKRAIIEIECGGETHRIEVRGEKATMLDHDEQMIESFTAFGAAPPVCLEFVREWKADPIASAMTLAPPPSEATHVACDDCGWTGSKHGVRQLDAIDELALRLDPSSIVPFGECPRCGAFVYLAFGSWKPEG